MRFLPHVYRKIPGKSTSNRNQGLHTKKKLTTKRHFINLCISAQTNPGNESRGCFLNTDAHLSVKLLSRVSTPEQGRTHRCTIQKLPFSWLTTLSTSNSVANQSLALLNSSFMPIRYRVSIESRMVAPKGWLPKMLPVWPLFDTGLSSFLPQA